jgi:hypothetical protein
MKIEDSDLIDGLINPIVLRKLKQYINCSYTSIIELPNSINIKEVDCEDCPGLTELPNWTNVNLVYCLNCPGLTELPKWNKVESVYCSNCPELKYLPDWRNIDTVYCSNCPELKYLPNWCNVKEVDCSNCPGLKELPDWVNVEKVYCSDCPNIKKLPEWPKLKFINCRRSYIFAFLYKSNPETLPLVAENNLGFTNAKEYHKILNKIYNIIRINIAYKRKNLPMDTYVLKYIGTFL